MPLFWKKVLLEVFSGVDFRNMYWIAFQRMLDLSTFLVIQIPFKNKSYLEGQYNSFVEPIRRFVTKHFEE